MLRTVKRLSLSGNLAVAYAVKQVDADVIPLYPITPSTTIGERIAEYVANGEMDAELVSVESEHSAISVALAASACGARAFTATSAQGLLLMHEMLFIASGLRLPVVMAVANRAVSAPISIWNDLSDAMAQRDTGWIQVFAETVQEVYDRMIQAYRIAEDSRVRLPLMVNYDGVLLSHTHSPVTPVDDSQALSFTPRVEPPFRLEPEQPVTIGGLGWPDYYYEAKYQSAKALEDSEAVVEEVDSLYSEMTGRRCGDVVPYPEGAELLLISAGSINGTIRTTVKKLREKGVSAGLLSLKLYRPFPRERILKLTGDAKAVGVVDRAFAPGGVAGPICTDVSCALYSAGRQVPMVNFIAGIGGRDVTTTDAATMYRELEKAASKGEGWWKMHYIGLRR